VTETGNQPANSKKQYSLNMALAAITGQVGCLTIVIILLALLAGLWLDNRFDTSPWFTLALLIGSMPITLILMFRIARSITSRMVMTPPEENTPQKENDIDRKDE
jgi:F0F1-type ATP synthase assembly protein I